jgi:tetratricopeptide (TPR) repeat protein
MSVQDSPPEFDELSAEPEALTVRRLVRAIDYAEGFWLGFAKSNTPAQRRRLAALCRDLLEPLKIRVLEIELTEPITDLLPILRERLAQESAANDEDATRNETPATTTQPKLAIFVHGLEHSISSREAYPPLLSSLNLKRELFRQEVPLPLLLWLPDYALTALARKAPDFWAWRSGLYEFAPEREAAEQSLEMIRAEVMHITDSLPERAKRERLAALKGLLDDYRELGDGLREQEARASLLNEIGLMHEVLGEWTEAKQGYVESLTISRNLNDSSGEAVALHNLGGIAQDQGELEEARRLYEESLDIKKRLDDQSGVAGTLHNLAMLAQAQGQMDEARRLYDESLVIAKDLGDQSGVAITLHQLAMLAEEQGEPDEARRLYDESLVMAKDLGDQQGISYTLHNLAILAQYQGELEEARRLYEESLDIKKRLGNQSGIADTLHQLGRLAEDEGDVAKAVRLFRESLIISEKINSPNAEITRRSLARVEGYEDVPN